MQEAVITRCSGMPDWEKIPSLNICRGLTDEKTDVRAKAQIAYDDRALYLHLSAVESEIRAVQEGLLGNPCEDSCLEFFFCPREGDLRYFNFEYNPKACMYLGFAGSIETLTRLLPDQDDENANTFAPEVNFTADGWEVTYEIPYTFIRRFFPEFAPAPGKTMRANFYKCAELTTAPHFLCWNPITREGRCLFHTPEEFGLLRFA